MGARGLTRSKASLYAAPTFPVTGEVGLFGLGFGEMLLIVAVALVVIGPKKLPGVARTLGRGIAEFKRHADDIQRTLHREIHAPLAADPTLRRMAEASGQNRPGPPPGSGTVQPPSQPAPDPYAQAGASPLEPAPEMPQAAAPTGEAPPEAQG